MKKIVFISRETCDTQGFKPDSGAPTPFHTCQQWMHYWPLALWISPCSDCQIRRPIPCAIWAAISAYSLINKCSVTASRQGLLSETFIWGEITEARYNCRLDMRISSPIILLSRKTICHWAFNFSSPLACLAHPRFSLGSGYHPHTLKRAAELPVWLSKIGATTLRI